MSVISRSSRRRVGAAIAALAGCIAGCDGMAEPVDREGIQITRQIQQVAVKPDGLTLPVGDTLRLRATAIPNPRIPVVFQWVVRPPGIASVDQAGLVRGLTRGDVEVVACTDQTEPVCGRAPVFVR